MVRWRKQPQIFPFYILILQLQSNTQNSKEGKKKKISIQIHHPQNIKANQTIQNQNLRISRTESEATLSEGRREALAGEIEVVDDVAEIGGRRAMADSDDGEDLAVGLEVFPGRRRSAAEDKLEAEAAGIPGLVGERRFLVLGVERADGGERDRLVAEQHGHVVPHETRWDLPDRKHRHSDHAAGLDADVRLH